jgi:type IV secretion system protein VirB6
MAAGLASGLALSTFGLVSQGLTWAFGGASRSIGQFARGAVLDKDTTRWDSLSRKAGYALRHGVMQGTRLGAHWRDNSIRAK